MDTRSDRAARSPAALGARLGRADRWSGEMHGNAAEVFRTGADIRHESIENLFSNFVGHPRPTNVMLSPDLKSPPVTAVPKQILDKPSRRSSVLRAG